MKKTLFLALMLMIAATSFAQQKIATLNHNDTISVFYGTYALRDAHNAAVAGDIVTLSPGTFEKCDITKPITLRGAGATVDTISGTFPTIISGDFKLSIYEHPEYCLTMEGIYINNSMQIISIYNAKFIKCFIYDMGSEKYYSTMNAEGIELHNCIIRRLQQTNSATLSTKYTLINTYAYIADLSIQTTLINSYVVLYTTTTNNYCIIKHLSAYNSIITRNVNAYFDSSSIAYHCIFITKTYDKDMYDNTNGTNIFFEKVSEVFLNYHSSAMKAFSFDARYILKEEIATSFLGSDGTEVGIHGGMFPFDTRPSYMVVKKCNVANKSTIDGKLSVDIEVMVEE